MPRRDLTQAHKIALLEQTKDQLPNTSHGQLAERMGVLKPTTACITQQHEKLRDEWTLCH
jgi:hypothetical protein